MIANKCYLFLIKQLSILNKTAKEMLPVNFLLILIFYVNFFTEEPELALSCCCLLTYFAEGVIVLIGS